MPSECCGIWLESAASCTSLGIKHLSALSVATTQIYLEATLAMKEQALARTTPPTGKPGRYRPGDRLLGFLNSL